MPFINDQLEANRRVIAEKQRPPGLRQTRFTFDPDHLSRTLKARIVGQDEALHRLDGLLQVVRADHWPQFPPFGCVPAHGPHRCR